MRWWSIGWLSRTKKGESDIWRYYVWKIRILDKNKQTTHTRCDCTSFFFKFQQRVLSFNNINSHSNGTKRNETKRNFFLRTTKPKKLSLYLTLSTNVNVCIIIQLKTTLALFIVSFLLTCIWDNIKQIFCAC